MSSQTESQKCPFCDRVFATPEYDEPRNSVIAHAVSLADDDHEGIGYTQVRRMIDARSETDVDVDVEQSVGDDRPDRAEPSASVDADQDDTARADGAGLGLGGPVPIDEEDDQEDVDEAPEPETVDCPHCSTDTELTPEEHEEGQRYRCDDCGGRYKWT